MLARGATPSAPFARVLDAARVPADSLTRWFFDFLAFALQGQRASGTPAAAVGFMMREFFADGAVMDYPKGGSGAVADALARAVTKRGGEVRLRTRVASLTFDGERCDGVELAAPSARRRPRRRRAAAAAGRVRGVAAEQRRHVGHGEAAAGGRAARLAAQGGGDAAARLRGTALDGGAPATPSFMHLHLAFNASGLDVRAPASTTSSRSTAGSRARRRSAPTARRGGRRRRARARGRRAQPRVHLDPERADDGAAPPGFAVLHAYLPATEPWAPWADLDDRASARTARSRRSAPRRCGAPSSASSPTSARARCSRWSVRRARTRAF